MVKINRFIYCQFLQMIFNEHDNVYVVNNANSLFSCLSFFKWNESTKGIIKFFHWLCLLRKFFIKQAAIGFHIARRRNEKLLSISINNKRNEYFYPMKRVIFNKKNLNHKFKENKIKTTKKLNCTKYAKQVPLYERFMTSEEK